MMATNAAVLAVQRDERKWEICRIWLTDLLFQPKYVAMTVGKSVALCEWSMGCRMQGAHDGQSTQCATKTYDYT